jgi:hypothetical protein
MNRLNREPGGRSIVPCVDQEVGFPEMGPVFLSSPLGILT